MKKKYREVDDSAVTGYSARIEKNREKAKRERGIEMRWSTNTVKRTDVTIRGVDGEALPLFVALRNNLRRRAINNNARTYYPSSRCVLLDERERGGAEQTSPHESFKCMQCPGALMH